MSNKYTDNFKRNKEFLSTYEIGSVVNIKQTFSPYIVYTNCKIVGIGATSILFQTLSNNMDHYSLLANIEINY